MGPANGWIDPDRCGENGPEPFVPNARVELWLLISFPRRVRPRLPARDNAISY
jgi:hypothetical protein